MADPTTTLPADLAALVTPPHPSRRVRAWHPKSGSLLVGDTIGEFIGETVSIIPDGLLEQVVLNRCVWVVVEV